MSRKRDWERSRRHHQKLDQARQKAEEDRKKSNDSKEVPQQHQKKKHKFALGKFVAFDSLKDMGKESLSKTKNNPISKEKKATKAPKPKCDIKVIPVPKKGTFIHNERKNEVKKVPKKKTIRYDKDDLIPLGKRKRAENSKPFVPEIAMNDQEWNQFVYDSISDISSDDELFAPDLAKTVNNSTSRDIPTIDNNI